MNLPTTGIIETRITSDLTTIVSESQSMRLQVREFGGQRWRLTAVYREMHRDEYEPLAAFVDGLRGRAMQFEYTPPDKMPRGILGGTPMVDGGSQSGNTLAIKDCTPDVTGWARAGDFFTIAGSPKAYKIIEDIDTDGSGDAELVFVPDLVFSPSDSAVMTFDGVTFTVRLDADRQQFGVSGLMSRRYEVSMVEVI